MDFELQYLLSLTVKEHFLLMQNKSREMKNLLEQNGHRKSAEILWSKDLEDLKYLRKIKKQKK